MAKKSFKHTGVYSYHDDDCWCVMGDNYCNRDGSVWSCCGACKKDSECSGSNMHPTYWNHPKFSQTVKEYINSRPVFKSNDEIRKIAPECFE